MTTIRTLLICFMKYTLILIAAVLLLGCGERNSPNQTVRISVASEVCMDVVVTNYVTNALKVSIRSFDHACLSCAKPIARGEEATRNRVSEWDIVTNYYHGGCAPKWDVAREGIAIIRTGKAQRLYKRTTKFLDGYTMEVECDENGNELK